MTAVHPREPRGVRRADIQGLRAFAVLVVVAFHAGLPLPGGFVGVDIFFVISGFVITAMLGREWQRSGRIGFGQFYLRRFWRLVPALALMVGVTAAISAVILPPFEPQWITAATGLGAMFMAANVVTALAGGGYFDVASESNPLLHTWSLSVEEQFYLFFPVVLFLAWSLARRRTCNALSRYVPSIAVGAIAVLSLALAVAGSRVVFTLPGASDVFGFYSPLTRAWEFAAGALLALTAGRWTPSNPRTSTLLGILGSVALMVSVLVIDKQTPFPGPWTLLPVVGTVFALLAGYGEANPVSRALSIRPMVMIGDWSYSIYLWHWPLIVFASLLWPHKPAAVLGAATLSLIPAVASYRWVEQPLRSVPTRKPRHRGVLVMVVVVPALAFSGALWVGVMRGWHSESVQRFQIATIPRHLGFERGCTVRKPATSGDFGDCVWNRGATGRPIYLVGDSNADQFSEGVIDAAGDLGRPISIGAPSVCPFVDLIVRQSTRTASDNEYCRQNVQQRLSYLDHAPPGLVVISNSEAYWRSDVFFVGESPMDLSGDPQRKIDVFREGLRRTVERLRSSGHEVMVFKPIPRWRDRATGDVTWDPSQCTNLAVMQARCVDNQPLERVVKERGSVHSDLEEIARSSGATFWDPAVALCPAGVCSTEAEGFTRYRDKGHISVAQSIALAPELLSAIERASARP